jgi:hypothetical protein
MGQKAICLLIIATLLLSIVPAIAPAGPQPASTSSSVSSGGGSGGSGSRLSLESFTNYLVSWQKENPAKYKYMIQLLSKGNVQAYMDPSLGLIFSKNKSVNRNEELDIKFEVQNPNPIDLRIPLFVDLEVMEPGGEGFKKVNQNSMVVQPFSYAEQGKINFFQSSWPEVTRLDQIDKMGLLKEKTGEIKFRAVYSDGSRKKYSTDWIFNPPYYGMLVLNLTNRPPEMKNISLIASNKTRYNDPIEYRATIDDADGDMINVTLHILDAKGKELDNETQRTLPGIVSFKAGEYGFFSETDAGKNFTYYYSFDDGINSNRTEIQPGPNLRRGPKLYVDKLNVTPESSNCYWWQWYTFSIRTKNQNPESFDVIFTLFSRTENSDWRTIESKTVKVGPEPQMIYFNKTEPFVVADANATFSYRIKLSEYEQNGRDSQEAVGPKINAKVVPYAIYDPIMVANLAILIFAILAGSLLLERKLKRGTESQESSSGKEGGNNGQDGNNTGNDKAGNISAMFKKRG